MGVMMEQKYLAIIGLIWGDEGKGIIVYSYAESYDVIVRFQGGPNAGHTLHLSSLKQVFHSIPCGALYPSKIIVIAGGCVIDIDKLLAEIESLEKISVYLKDSLKIYGNTTIITDFEITMDVAMENFLSKKGKSIGTTRSGIGDAYANRAYRTAIIAEDLLDMKVLKEKIYALADITNPQLLALGADALDPELVFQKMQSQAEKFCNYIVTNTYLAKLQKEGKNILFEGAQAILLDTLNGSYPYVTSSSPHPGTIGPSCGISTKNIHTIGVAKIYPSRVGEGPFPTQIGGSEEELLRKYGHEYGATTGRARKCGYIDIPLLKYSILVSGVDEIILTCFDTLYKMNKTKICVAYEIDGKRVDIAPGATPRILSNVKPVYEDFSFSKMDISGINSWNDLPEPAKEFIKKVQSYLDIPISKVKTGPDVKDVIDIPQ